MLVYDICNVSPEAAPEIQIQPGSQFESRFGKLTVVQHRTPPGAMNKKEGGRVIVHCEGSTDVDLDLLHLQLAVLRKLPLSREGTNKSVVRPVLEWPPDPDLNEDEFVDEESHFDICEGLSLHRKQCSHITRAPDHKSARYLATNCVVNNSCDVRPGCTFGMWDPAGKSSTYDELRKKGLHLIIHFQSHRDTSLNVEQALLICRLLY